jgi:hypothetical protein
MGGPHDILFAFTFGQPEHAKCLLRLLPEAAGDEAVRKALLRWVDLVRAVEAGHRGQQAIEVMTCYILCVTDLPADQLTALFAQILDKPTESYVMSTANRLKQEGKAEGMAEATAEARERLLRQLAVRFGNVPSSIEIRVRRASKQDLDVWSIRLLEAKSLLEVFAGE